MENYSRTKRRQQEKKDSAWNWAGPFFYITAASKNLYEFVKSISN